MLTLLPSYQAQRDARKAFDAEAIAADWTVVVSGDLIQRELTNGQLAAVWRYSDHTGTDCYKLFTDRDCGDFVGLDFAIATAVVIESLGAVDAVDWDAVQDGIAGESDWEAWAEA